MKIFIDLDDVIFNAKKFKKDLTKVFIKNGISCPEFDISYRSFSWNLRGKPRYYDPQEQIDFLSSEKDIDRKKLMKNINSLMVDLRKYIFKDFYKFIKYFPKKELYLITYGNKKFQEKKVRNSGISKYFERIVITDRPKANAIEKLIKRDKIKKGEILYFIDDRIEYIENVKKKYPKIATFFIKRKEGRCKDKKNKYCDFEVGNLGDVLRVICNF